jgi:hypothetical protein
MTKQAIHHEVGEILEYGMGQVETVIEAGTAAKGRYHITKMMTGPRGALYTLVWEGELAPHLTASSLIALQVKL